MIKSFVSLLFVLTAFGSKAFAVCLDISGSYELDSRIHAGIIPNCSPGKVSTKAWEKLEQAGCSAVTHSTVYKLVDGTFCETAKGTRIADGAERPLWLDYNYTYQIFGDRHVVTHINRSNRSTLVFVKTLDPNGNLVSGGEDPSPKDAVYPKSPIQ